MATFVIGPSETEEFIKTGFLCNVSTDVTVKAEPYGREALKLLGGVFQDKEEKAAESNFDMSLIKIPDNITPQTLRSFTLYQILGFGNEGLGDSADMETIKKCYHKAVLMYHPDKAQFQDANGKEDRTVFLKIQEAFAVLTDEKKRRAYDSQLPFDEAIPDQDITDKYLAKGPEKFFRLYGPVFKRNARFSSVKPVPELGDMNTPMDQVYQFYQFWVKFDSWRDFTGVGADSNPDDAGSRYEKRHIEKENKKLAERLKKKEINRIIDLVTLSEKNDPRVVADKAAQKAAKASAKSSREEAAALSEKMKTDALEWIAAQEESFKAAKMESKAEREKAKKKQSAARNLLKKLLRVTAALGHGSEGEYGILPEADVDVICAQATMDDLTTMNTAMGGDAAFKDNSVFVVDGIDVVKNMLVKLQSKQGWALEDERIARDARKREAEEKTSGKKKAMAEERVWTDMDRGCLADAYERYPLGHLTRWNAITNYVNDRQNPEVSFSELEVQIQAFAQFK